MEDLFVKLYKNEDDYDTIKTWAMKKGLAFPLEEALPGVGVIVIDKKGKKYGCAFLYLDNETIVSIMEWVFVNPDTTPKEKHKTMEVILDNMERCANAEEHPLMMTGSSASGIVRLYQKHGWKVMEHGVTHLIKNTQKVGT